MISWNEILENLKGEVQDKSKNPFFGAFIATWIIRHWEVVYILFNFDEEFHLDAKLYRLNCYFSTLPESDFWWTIVVTFGVIILGYGLLNLARIISNVSEKIITPLIYKWTAGKASIVTKETYDQALLWEKIAKEKLEQQIKENATLRTEVEDWEKRFRAINQQLTEKIDKEVDEEIKRTQVAKTEDVKLKDSIPSSMESAPNETTDLKPFAKAIWSSMPTGKGIEFQKTVEKIDTNDVFLKDSIEVSQLKNTGLIEQVGKPVGKFSKFKLTPLGEELKKLLSSEII